MKLFVFDLVLAQAPAQNRQALVCYPAIEAH